MQIKCRYSIKDNNNIKIPLRHVRKIKNITKNKILATDRTIHLTNVKRNRKKSDFSIW